MATMSLNATSVTNTTSENDTSPYKTTPKRRVRTERQLARKREIDRQAQYQIRHKNKERMEIMEKTVAELQANFNRVSKTLEGVQSLMRGIVDSNRRASSSTTIFQTQYPMILDPPINLLSNAQAAHGAGNHILDSNLASPQDHTSPTATHDGYQYSSLPTPSPARSPLPKLMNNPASPSMTNTIEAAECFATCAFNILSRAHLDLLKDIRSQQRISRSPTLGNMLLIDINSNPVVKVISCSFRHCSPSNVADTMASYFIMYRLLRWRVHPDPESYEDVPSWYRPSEIQENVPHNLSYDFWAWPQLRNALLSGDYTYCQIKFNMDMCEHITIGWPEEKPLIVKNSCDGSVQAHPDFEQHVMQYENWKVKRAWAGLYPELVGFVNIADE